MKLAIIRMECSYRKGGAERYAANLCKILAEAGHQVWVLAETFDPLIHPDLIHVPVKVNHFTSATRSLSFHRNSQKALAKIEPDCVLALSRSYPSDAFRVSDPLHRYWMKVRYPGRLHRLFQSLNPRHRAILKLESHILDPRNTRFIITNSRLSKRLIRENYDYPEDRIRVIYNGVDHDQFTPDPDRQSSAGIRLLFVGQDFKRKGLAPLIEALALLKSRGVTCTLRVIGRDDPAIYQKQARRLGVGELVEFQGPFGDIEQAYQSADLFVFPTLYDPFANVCLEALACGLPVLTTDTNGSSEVISEGANGYVVPGNGTNLPVDLADKIGMFCALPGVARLEMGLCAAREALGYTTGANATAVVELLARNGGAA